MKPRFTIPFAALKQGANRFTYELRPGDIGLNRREVSENPSFAELVGTVRIQLDIVRSGQRVLVSGLVEFSARLGCALCGDDYDSGFREPLCAEFVDAGSSGGAADADGRRDRGPGDAIEVIPLVHDAIHLAVPIAPCCRSDCKGICPECGENLNRGPCQCRPASGG